MKIAFVYGPFSLGNRHIDFDQLEDSPRGLTGSELSCVRYATGMARRGHDVSLFIDQAPGTPPDRPWRGIRLAVLDRFEGTSGWDVVYSWNEPDVLRSAPKGAFCVVNQQLNDFGYCRPGYDEYVDLYTSPSPSHRDYLQTISPSPAKWEVMPNGCDPDEYVGPGHVPGRVIWASSADRGLHVLLQAWPGIRKLAPQATLRCFYNFDYAKFDAIPDEAPHHPDVREIAQRARYIRDAMRRLAPYGVEHVGGVSRRRMIREMCEAEVLAYPVETIRFTEGFSVTTMEACAAGVLPIISNADSMGQIYGDAAPMVAFPPSAHLQEYTELVARALNDVPWRVEQAKKTLRLADAYRWPALCEKLEALLESRLRAEKRRAVPAISPEHPREPRAEGLDWGAT